MRDKGEGSRNRADRGENKGAQPSIVYRSIAPRRYPHSRPNRRDLGLRYSLIAPYRNPQLQRRQNYADLAPLTHSIECAVVPSNNPFTSDYYHLILGPLGSPPPGRLPADRPPLPAPL